MIPPWLEPLSSRREARSWELRIVEALLAGLEEKMNEESGQGLLALNQVNEPQIEDCKLQPHHEELESYFQSTYGHGEGLE